MLQHLALVASLISLSLGAATPIIGGKKVSANDVCYACGGWAQQVEDVDYLINAGCAFFTPAMAGGATALGLLIGGHQLDGKQVAMLTTITAMQGATAGVFTTAICLDMFKSFSTACFCENNETPGGTSEIRIDRARAQYRMAQQDPFATYATVGLNMGQGHSDEHVAHNVSTEQLSHELALRFAKKCFTPLEITHFKDVFRSLADDQDGIHYWKEETLCRFLVIPDALGPGPLIYQMATYLGAFPFPSLAPSILTIEALLKVVVIMTERYGTVLKRGRADRNKLLFRSLAVFDRRMSSVFEKPPQEIIDAVKEEKSEKVDTSDAVLEEARSQAAGEEPKSALGFAIDKPANDEEEDEDDDELALAALDSLDAIEVFKYDQRADTKIHHAQIPVDNFRRLIMLLLVIAPLDSQESLSRHAERLTPVRLERLKQVADSILWSFTPEKNAGIFYQSFNKIIPASLPHMFDGLNPLFEHFLFSKNIDLSKRRHSSASPAVTSPTVSHVPDTPLEPLLPREGDILNLDILCQLSFFIKGSNLFRRLRPLYLGADAGFSLGSIEQKVFNWRAPSILLVSGTRLSSTPEGTRERSFADTLPTKRFPDGASGNKPNGRVVFGAYIDVPWKHTYREAIGGSEMLLFQLSPLHEVFRASTLSRDYLTFTKTGVGFGCPPPRVKAVSGLSPHTVLGPVSLTLDSSLEFGVFTHDSTGGGSFHPSQTRNSDWQDRFEIESLEIWGCGGDEEAERQRAAWVFEEREAEARRNLKLGKDREADRALLEMAGLVGNHNASGGSMG
ncbi:MAG: hypothetical protein Q9228_004469 [Teloschistes exilis]